MVSEIVIVVLKDERDDMYRYVTKTFLVKAKDDSVKTMLIERIKRIREIVKMQYQLEEIVKLAEEYGEIEEVHHELV